MDNERFDCLARIIGKGTTRRVLFAALTALAPRGIAIMGVDAKKRKKRKKKKCKPPCGECESCARKQCVPARDGASCPGGACRGGVCFGGGGAGNCTVLPDNGVSLLVEGRFDGQPLQAQKIVQPLGAAGETASTLDVTLGGEPLLTVETEGVAGVVTVTVTYGDAFGGIKRSRLTSNGTTMTGEIDGRAIVPAPIGADPNQIQFEDGAPPPEVKITPDLAAAVEGILKQAEDEAATCGAAQRGRQRAAPRGVAQHQQGKGGKAQHEKDRRGNAKGRNGRRNKANDRVSAQEHPEDDIECLLLYVPCQTDALACEYGAVTGCLVTLFGYVACVLVATGLCVVKAEKCRRAIRHNAPCCPVRCGGDPENSVFGSDPFCCEDGETCLDPRSNRTVCCAPGQTACAGRACCAAGETCSPDGVCCPAGQISCGGVCCTAADCIGGSCCEPPSGGICNGVCCPPLASCCGGDCCTGICNGNSCCTGSHVPCGSACCSTSNVCCAGTCCKLGESCVSGTCTPLCGFGQHACPADGSPPCCLGSQECCPNGECCNSGTTCCFKNNSFHCSPTGCIA